MRFLLFAIGSGESSQGYAIGRYLVEKKHQVIFALRQDAMVPFYASASFSDLVVTPTPHALQELVRKVQPDAILLCNSKTFNDDTAFVESSPWKSIPTFSVDANWLFEPTGSMRCIQWLDRYFVTFPPDVFELGLKENGGHFAIPPDVQPRVEAVGFIPFYQKPDAQEKARVRQALSIQPHEKLVFCYVSGYGASVRGFVLQGVLSAVSQLRKKGREIKVFAAGQLDCIQTHPSCDADWLVRHGQTAIDDFYAHVASADLVFQHQGLITIAQAISAHVPIIANIEGLFDVDGSLRLEIGEVLPLQRAGLCHFFFKQSNLCEVQNTIEALLYDEREICKIQQAQRNYCSSGEQCLYNAIMAYLSSHSRQTDYAANAFISR